MHFTSVIDPLGSSHGTGKILTYAVLESFRCEGEIYYIAYDVFGHGKKPCILIIKRMGGKFDVKPLWK